MTTMLYIETDIPIGMTISQYRRQRPPRPRGWRRFLKLFA